MMNKFLRTRLERTPALILKLMPRVWFRVPQTEQTVFFTFDDGPHPERTPLVLETLERFGASATFFLIGKRAQQRPDLVKVIAQRHRIGNHTWSHPNLRGKTAQLFSEELESTRSLLENLTGSEVPLFRPPYGSFGPALLRYARRHDHHIVLWHVLPWDFLTQRSAQAVADCILRYATGGSIVVLHDGHPCAEKTVQALHLVLPVLRDRGFNFAALPNRLLPAGAAIPLPQPGLLPQQQIST